MILKVNDDYRISTDALNIMLEKKRIVKEGTTSKTLKAGDEVWDTIGFYGEFEHVYRAMVKHGIMASDLEGLQAIIKEIDRIGHAVKESLSTASIDSLRREIDRLSAEVDRLKEVTK
jgi:hypothetical protein